MPPEVPATPAALAEQAAALGCALDAGQATLLTAYLDLLARWNQVHNLTAVRNRADMVTQHLLDCLAVLAPLRRHLAGSPNSRPGGQPVRLLDVGSGGGLPGIVIAIAAPEIQITCVDAVAKKAAFITQAQAELRLANLAAQHARVEQLRLPPFDVITSRALGSLEELVAWTRNLLAPGGAWMAMKGAHPAKEIAELGDAATVFHVEHLDIPALKAERCLVWLHP
jgi:16S rRNA (guanine527-N7)-methyltransferase